MKLCISSLPLLIRNQWTTMNLIRGHSELLRQICESRVQDLPDRYRMIYRMCTFLNVIEALAADILKNMTRNRRRKRKTFSANLKNKSICDYLSTH